MIVFEVIALQSVLAVHALLCTDEAEARIIKRNTVVGVPAAQHGARNLAGHAADRRSAPDPARRRIADPGLAIRFKHVFDVNAADPVGQIVILRGRHRRRQVRKTELFKARQEAFLLLAAKYLEYELGGLRRAQARHRRENESGKIGVIERGHGSPSLPFGVLRALLCRHHFRPLSVPDPILARLDFWHSSACRINRGCAVKVLRLLLLYGRWRGTGMRKSIPLSRNPLVAILLVAFVLPLAACGEKEPETAASAQTYGPTPKLPAPENSLIPTVNVAKAVGWPAGGKPIAADGMAVNAFAERPRPSAHASRPAERRCAGGRDQRAVAARGGKGHQGLDHKAGDGPRRRRHD